DVLGAVTTGKNGGVPKEHQFCSNFPGRQEECVHIAGCSVRPVWNLISSYFHSVLRDLTLADLIGMETEVSRKVEEVARRKSEQITTMFRQPSEGRKQAAARAKEPEAAKELAK